MAAAKPDYDSPWKEALEQYFPAFIQLLAPALYKLIEWSHPPVFLDKELQAVNHASSDGKRYADKLVQVRGKDTLFFWIVVHVEIQGGRITTRSLKQFSERMYQYNYRILDHYGQTLVQPKQLPKTVGLISLGVLTAGKSAATDLVYQRDVLGLCHTQFRFPVVYLANWLDRWSELQQLAASNPFAVLVMAQLQAQRTGKDERQKLVSKTQIMRLLYAYHYSDKDIKQLFRLVDWMLITPPELEAEFKQTMITIELEQNMTYMNTIERVSRREGKQEGEAEMLERLLAQKFGQLPARIEERLKNATSVQLESWSLNILDAKALDDVFTD